MKYNQTARSYEKKNDNHMENVTFEYLFAFLSICIS